MGNLRVDNLLRRTVSLPRLLPDDTQAQHLIKTASEMDTRRALASVGLKDLGLDIKLDLKPKHAYLLLVTLGSGEFFGPNENADYNPEHDGKVVHFPEPCDPNVKSMTLGKGLESTHKTFGIHGAVYKHHKTEPEHDVPRSGDIVWDRWNSDMHRGEVIAELPEEKWTEELSLSEQGIPLMWSQGNGVPSDVCFPKGALIDTAYGQVPIERVVEDMQVTTHKGRWRRVDKTMERSYTGIMVTLSALGNPQSTSTGNHPYLIIPEEGLFSCQGSNKGKKRRHTYNDQSKCTTCGRLAPDPMWRAAADIRIGDTVLTPVRGRTDGVDDEDLAYVLGVYAGDGHIVSERHTRDRNDPRRRDYGVGITMGETDPHMDRLKEALASIVKPKVSAYPYTDGRKAIAVICRSKKLAAMCRSAIGSGSHDKGVHISFGTPEAGLSFLGGYMDSDGSYDSGDGTSRILTVSRELAYSARRVALQAGLFPTLRKEHLDGKGTYSSNTKWVYWLFFGREDTEKLAGYSLKVPQSTTANRSHKQTIVISYPNGMVYQGFTVNGLEHEIVAGLPVYNISVEDDESYVANGLAVHNCSRCGFVFTPKSKSRCRHIKLRKLCIEDDGIQNVIHCASALFYDMSFVGNNPADKIATALLRVASPEMAESTHSRRPSLKETMRIHHVCRYSPAAVDLAIHRAEMELDGTSVPGIRIACMPDPDKDAEFVKEARSEDSGKVLAVLHRLEIVLTPTQFARIFGPEAEPTGVSGYIDALPGAFRRLREEDPGYTDDAGYFPSQPPDSSLRRKLEPFKADFDIGETLRKPVVIVAKSASVPGSLRPTESGKAMAGEYAKYLRTCLATFAGPQAADRCVGIMNAGL